MYICVVQSASASLGLLFKRVQWWACSLSHFWWQGISKSDISLYSFHYISFYWTRTYFHETRVTLSLIELTHWFLWVLIDVTLLDEKINLRSLPYRCWCRLWCWQQQFNTLATDWNCLLGGLPPICDYVICDAPLKEVCLLYFSVVWAVVSGEII